MFVYDPTAGYIETPGGIGKFIEFDSNAKTVLVECNNEYLALYPVFNSMYAPLSNILNLVRPILSKHGLSIIQSPSGDGQNITVTTLIMHTSGEWIESDPPESCFVKGVK